MPLNIKPSSKNDSSWGTPQEGKAISIPKNNNSKSPTDLIEENIEENKKKAKFYLPVLYINDPTQWPSKPMSERQHFTDEVAKATCLGNCCNVKDLRAGMLSAWPWWHRTCPWACRWGGIKKTIKWIAMEEWTYVTRHDIVIDYEEGKLIGKDIFQRPPSL